MNQYSQDPMMDRNDEAVSVDLSGRDARAAIHLLNALVSAWNQNASTDTPPVIATTNGRDRLVGQAKAILRRRRQRASVFGSVMFGEPAWDMLLALYTEEPRNRLTVGRLVDLSGSPSTTGLRWLDYLETHQLVCRRSVPTDARAFFVDLTDKARDALDSYFSETLKKPL